MARDLKEYSLYLGDADLKRVQALHQLTGEFKDGFLTDPELQDFLLNQGYALEDCERPTSLRRYQTTINGMRVCCHLNFLDLALNAIQEPISVLTIHSKPILLPGEDDEIQIKTLEGYDALGVASLQTEWTENSRVRNLVNQFRGNLETALDEYSMQLILFGIQCACQNSLPDEPGFQEVRALQQRARETLDKNAYHVLDNAYYNKGNHFFRSAGKTYKQLQADPLGKKFILSIEEEQQALALWGRRQPD